MTTEPKSNEEQIRKPKVIYKGGASEAVYGLGLIGAWVYYLSHALVGIHREPIQVSGVARRCCSDCLVAP